MKNYIANHDFRALLPWTPTIEGQLTAMGATWGTQADSQTGETYLTALHGVTSAPPSGLAPFYGAGPGPGAMANYDFVTLPPNHDLFTNDPTRALSIQWTVPMNPAIPQNSGWEPGAVNPDGTPRHVGQSHPWRYTFLEIPLHNTQHLLGETLIYYCEALKSNDGNVFPIKPLFWVNWASHHFTLYDLGKEFAVDGNGVTRIEGIFKLPDMEASRTVYDEGQFYVGFGLDSTIANPGDILLTNFHVGVLGEDVPRLFDVASMASLRIVNGRWTVET